MFAQHTTHYAPLGSPGDGWRPMLRPVPVAPLFGAPLAPGTFHFLSPEPHPSAASSSRQRLTARPSWDQRDTHRLARFNALPNELLSDILELAVEAGDGPALAATSPRFRNLSQPFLYRRLRLGSAESVELLLRTLQDAPELASHARRLTLRAQRVPWTAMTGLAEILKARGKVRALEISMPASELSHAMDALSRLSPETFEWHTSPCWTMRPTELFVQLLSSWPRLRRLHLSGFAYDLTCARVLEQVPGLQEVSMQGCSLRRLTGEVLVALLSSSDSTLDKLSLRGCSAQERVLVEASALQLLAEQDVTAARAARFMYEAVQGAGGLWTPPSSPVDSKDESLPRAATSETRRRIRDVLQWD